MRLLAPTLAVLIGASCITPEDIDARLDPDGDGWDDDADCDDEDPAVNPGAEEVCDNGKDDDCDPATDCRWTSGEASALGVSVGLPARPRAMAWLPRGAAEGGLILVDADGDLARYTLDDNGTPTTRARVGFCAAPVEGATAQIGDGDGDGEPDLLVDCWGMSARAAWWSHVDTESLARASTEIRWARSAPDARLPIAIRPAGSANGLALVGVHAAEANLWVAWPQMGDEEEITRDTTRPLGPAIDMPAQLIALTDRDGTLPPLLLATSSPSEGDPPSARPWPTDPATLPPAVDIAGIVSGETLHVTASAVDLTSDGEPNVVGYIEGGAAGTHRIFAAEWSSEGGRLDLDAGVTFTDSASTWSILGVATPDLNHDGQADLAALLVHEGAWQVAVAWGPIAPGSRDFEAFDLTIQLGDGPPAIALLTHGDANHDGWDDLFVAESASTPRLWLFLGQGQ